MPPVHADTLDRIFLDPIDEIDLDPSPKTRTRPPVSMITEMKFSKPYQQLLVEYRGLRDTIKILEEEIKARINGRTGPERSHELISIQAVQAEATRLREEIITIPTAIMNCGSSSSKGPEGTFVQEQQTLHEAPPAQTHQPFKRAPKDQTYQWFNAQQERIVDQDKMIQDLKQQLADMTSILEHTSTHE